MHSAERRYPKLPKKKREELAALIGQELTPYIGDAAGVQAFGVADENDVLTTATVFESESAARSAAERPAVDAALTPETSVREVPPPKPPKNAKRGS